MKTHYDVLGVARDADYETIKAAYRRALKGSHPDLHEGDGKAEERSKQIIDAHAILKDPDQRARYDEVLRVRSQQHRRLFMITFLLSATVVCAASLAALYTFAPQRAQSMLEAILPAPLPDAAPRAVADAGDAAADAPPAADIDAAPSPVVEARRAPSPPPSRAEPPAPDAPAAAPAPGPVPKRAQPKVALETDWLDVSRSGDMVRVWNFHLANRDRMEGALALSWLERSIAASEDAAGLRTLRDLAGDALTQRINSRLATLATAAKRRELAVVAEPYPDAPRAQVAEGQPMTTGAIADLAFLDQAVTREPHNADNYLRRAAAFSTRGRLDRALADYDTAIRLDGGSSAAFHERGLLRLRLGAVDKAMADLDLAIRLGANARIYRDRGTIWFSRRAFDQAIADFDSAIRLDPNFASAYLHRGLAHKQMGATESATADFMEATRLDPALADAQRAAASPSASERGRRAAMPAPYGPPAN